MMISDKEKTILEDAAEIVAGARRVDYGDASRSFERIAKLWSAYLGSVVSAHDVVQLMILLKVSRSKEGIDRNGLPQFDSLVDIAGYTACAQLIEEGERW